MTVAQGASADITMKLGNQATKSCRAKLVSLFYACYFADPDGNLWEIYAWVGDPDGYHQTFEEP